MKPHRAKVEHLALRDTAGRSATGATDPVARYGCFIYTPRA